MNEKIETIKMNGVNFKFNKDGMPVNFKDNGSEALRKLKQTLFSWKCFYSGKEDVLFASRYHKTFQIKNGEKILVDKYIDDVPNSHYLQAISYSRRQRLDRMASNKITLEINEVQKKLDEKFNYKINK